MLGILLVLLMLAWVGLHLFIVPRIDHLRPQLESWVSRSLGAELRIGQLQAESTGLVPTIEVRQLQIIDRDGQAGLQVPRALASFSVTSLLRGALLQLVIDEPELQVRRMAAGHWRVAGIDWQGEHQSDHRALRWVLRQPELLIRQGRMLWRDEGRGLQALELEQIDAVLSNRLRHHRLRLDATPPPEWGERFTVVTRLREHVLAPGLEAWDDWSGELYADFPRFDASRWRSALDLGNRWGIREHSGHGAVRVWLDLQRGHLSAATADVALRQLSLQLAPELKPLDLEHLQGRLDWSVRGQRSELSSKNLQFSDTAGLVWPGGNFRFMQQQGPAAQGQLQGEHWSLGAMAQLADHLPLPQALRQWLEQHRVGGHIPQFALDWQGPLEEVKDWDLQLQAQGLKLVSRAAEAQVPAEIGLPQMEGLGVELRASQDGGQARMHMQDGALSFPGVFEQPRIPVQQLEAKLAWQLQDERIDVQLSQLQLSNADAQGHFEGHWHTGAHADGSGARFPGVLNLKGSFSRADGTAVHRYLPLVIPEEARHYVRDAIRQGEARDVQVQVQGPLDQFPFNQAGEEGVFRIAGAVSGVVMDYVPAWLLLQGQPPWPPLEQLQGQLIFDKASMQVRDASARVRGHANWRFADIRADIADLEHARVQVQAQGSGALATALDIVRVSPVAGFISHALDEAQAEGAARLQLGLDLPIEDIDRSRVSGQVQLQDNRVQLSPAAPVLEQARGRVDFSESGFAIQDVAVHALGGPATITGGLDTRQDDDRVQVQARGTASAEGLRQMQGWGPVLQLSHHASGSAAYTLDLSFDGPHMALDVHSDLRGLQLDWPAPLHKPADSAWPLHYQQQARPDGERLQLSVDSLLRVDYAWDADSNPPSLRGALALGQAAQQALELPTRGITARVQLPALDLDAWRQALAEVPAAEDPDTAPVLAPGQLPDHWTLEIGQLQLAQRHWHDITLQARQQNGHWGAQLQGRELAGSIEYNSPTTAAQAGALQAQLSRLHLPKALDTEPSEPAPPRTDERLPALDVHVTDFRLHELPLGQLQVQAHNQSSDLWELSRLDLQNPDAHFSATGHWGSPASPDHTDLDFKLDVRHAGKLLERLGMEGVLRGGQGSLEGQVSWRGSPLELDYPSLQGELALDIGAGQFLKTEPGVAKLLGVLSLQALPRRLSLDFRDVFSAGFAFDFVRGNALIRSGVLHTNNLQMKGVNAAVLMDGSADLQHETQQLRVLVVPEIDAGTAALAAGVINPAIGIGAFLAQLILKQPLMQAATREFEISGSWDSPQIEAIPRPVEPAPDPLLN